MHHSDGIHGVGMRVNANQIAFMSAYGKFGLVVAAAVGGSVSRDSHYCLLKWVEYAAVLRQACEALHFAVDDYDASTCRQ
jgi:hypothetical protein